MGALALLLATGVRVFMDSDDPDARVYVSDGRTDTLACQAPCGVDLDLPDGARLYVVGGGTRSQPFDLDGVEEPVSIRVRTPKPWLPPLGVVSVLLGSTMIAGAIVFTAMASGNDLALLLGLPLLLELGGLGGALVIGGVLMLDADVEFELNPYGR